MNKFFKCFGNIPITISSLALFIFAEACKPAQVYEFNYLSDAELRSTLEQNVAHYPEANFIVFSDPHIYDPDLGISGSAFESSLNTDRKLLRESTLIMEALIRNIESMEADFVLVAGDLTKDGELSSHRLAAFYLSQIETSGKSVYVVPGNHDINNGHSMRYVDSASRRVPTVTAEEFAGIYADFGYDESLFRDTASLSYVVEPKPGLWLLALDACLYSQNEPDMKPLTGGKFSASTLAWMEDTLLRAQREHKAVIAMIHHGIVEHYKGQDKDFGEYIVDNYIEIANLLSAYNVRLALSGHYHAQDITLHQTHNNKDFIYDIETGSLVTWPCPYRLIEINGMQKVIIRSDHITSIEGFHGNFHDYAYNFIRCSVEDIAYDLISSYGVRQDEAQLLSKRAADAVMAHYQGDELLPALKEALPSHGLGLMARLVVLTQKDFIDSLWHDLEPQDNNVILDLNTAEGR